MILSKRKFVLYITTKFPAVAGSLLSGDRWDRCMRHRGRKKEKKRTASSDAAGRKIANILRHRATLRARWSFQLAARVCIYTREQTVPFCGHLVVKAPKFTSGKRRQCRSRARSDISIWFKPTKQGKRSVRMSFSGAVSLPRNKFGSEHKGILMNFCSADFQIVSQ